MVSLSVGPDEESAEQRRLWAQRFNHHAYRRRLAELIEELQ